jgi:dCMP deaminase
MNHSDSIYVDLLIGLTSESTCLRRRTAAVLVDQYGSILGIGTNGAPASVNACTTTGKCLRMDVKRGHALDQCVAVHAEMNAIADACRKAPIPPKVTIFCTDSPCLNCLKEIITVGIKDIRYLREYPIACSAAYNAIAEGLSIKLIDVKDIIESKSFDMSL